MPGGPHRDRGRFRRAARRRERLAEPGDRQQGVVDAQTEPDHRYEALEQDRERPTRAEQPGDAQGEPDHERAAQHRCRRRRESAEGRDQEHESHGKRAPLRGPGARSARLPQVGVENRLPGPAQRERREARGQPAREGGRRVAQARHDRIGALQRGVEPHQHERPPGCAADEQRVARVPVGADRHDAGHGSHHARDAVDQLPPLRPGRQGRAPHHQQRVVRVRRTEARDLLRLDARRLAPLHAGACLEYPLHAHRVRRDQGEGRGPAGDDQAAVADDRTHGIHALELRRRSSRRRQARAVLP